MSNGSPSKFGRLTALGLLLLAAGCGGGGSNSPGMTDPGVPPPTNSVSGVVTFKGVPMAGVKVTAFETNTNSVVTSATTDANGQFTMDGFSTSGNVTANYQFWADAAGYAFYPSTGPGANVTRMDYTGQYASIYAIYKTVINYDSLVNTPLASADFSAFDGSNPLVAVAATGQRTSYSAGDDGALRAGVAWPAARFIDNGDGSVSDKLTGLVWLRDAGCLAPAVWATAVDEVHQLASGACGLSDGSSAGAWRLPNIVELESIVDSSASNPAISAGSPFVNVSNLIYWSSTSYFGGQTGSPNAWAVRFADGRYMNDSVANLKISAVNAVWAVRDGGKGAVALQASGAYVSFASGDDGALRKGVPLTYPRMIDHGDGTVTDSVTGLRWLRQANCLQGTWSEALAAVGALASGQCGLTDGSAAGSWRMPSRKELESLSDRALNNHADSFDTNYVNTVGVGDQAPVFSTLVVSAYYWTSTTDAAATTSAWTVYSCDFGVYDTPKSNIGYTLAVR